MTEPRRLARFIVTEEMLTQLLRGGRPVTPDGWCEWHESDLPSDLRIEQVHYNHSYMGLEILAESESFKRVHPGEEIPNRHIQMWRHRQKLVVSVALEPKS